MSRGVMREDFSKDDLEYRTEGAVGTSGKIRMAEALDGQLELCFDTADDGQMEMRFETTDEQKVDVKPKAELDVAVLEVEAELDAAILEAEAKLDVAALEAEAELDAAALEEEAELDAAILEAEAKLNAADLKPEAGTGDEVKVKRKPGRPRKVKDSGTEGSGGETKEKRKRGRPRKQKEPEPEKINIKPEYAGPMGFINMIRDHAKRQRLELRLEKYPPELLLDDDDVMIWKIPPETFACPTEFTSELTELACIRLYDDPFVPMSVKFNLDVEVKKSRKKPAIIEPLKED